MKNKIKPKRNLIEFDTKDRLNIKITTPRLIIRSLQSDDLKNTIEIFADPIVMEKFAEGVPSPADETTEYVEKCLTRWKNHDPYNCYVIVDKASKAFMGIFILGHNAPGEIDISYLLHYQFWGKGFGREIAAAMFQSLVPRLMMRGYQLENKDVKKIVATARLDNPASQKMLQGTGFQKQGTVFEYGGWRYAYENYTKQLKNNYHHYYNNLDKAMRSLESLHIRDNDLDVTAKEMADSAFGRQTFTAKGR
jgi:RimJ/RimL family protein N-acetyltransferase